MKVKVKTLTNEEFHLDNIESGDTISQIKTAITEKSSKEVKNLIYKGKILEDSKTLFSYGFEESGFLVCIFQTKSRKPATPAASTSTTTTSLPTTSVAAPSTNNLPSLSAPSSTSTSATTSQSSTTVTPPATTTPTTTSTASTSPQQGADYSESLPQIVAMGFSEAQARQALGMTGGNVQMALELLISGNVPEVPSGVPTPSSTTNTTSQTGGVTSSSSTTQASSSTGGASTDSNDPLAPLRRHPMLNELKRAVQEDPSRLGQLLQHIGQTNPDLMRAINSDRQGFIQLMNEPIDESATSTSQNTQSTTGMPNLGGLGAGGAGGGAAGLSSLLGGMGGGSGGPSPEQFAMLLAQMSNIPQEDRERLANEMGIAPEQLQAVMQMMQTMPPEAMSQMLGAALGGGGMPGMGGGGGGGGGVPGMGSPQVVRLTQEQLDSVNRLMELGFSRSDCVEALLACENNEEMAANYLFSSMDSMGDGGGEGDGGSGDSAN